MRRTLLAALAVGAVALAGCTQPAATVTVTTTESPSASGPSADSPTTGTSTTAAPSGPTTAPSSPARTTPTRTTPTQPTPQPSSRLPSIIMNPEVLITELNARGIRCRGEWRETDEGQGQRCAAPKVWVYIDATQGELVSWMREIFETEFNRDGGVTGRGNWVIGAGAEAWPAVQGI